MSKNIINHFHHYRDRHHLNFVLYFELALQVLFALQNITQLTIKA